MQSASLAPVDCIQNSSDLSKSQDRVQVRLGPQQPSPPPAASPMHELLYFISFNHRLFALRCINVDRFVLITAF